MTLTVAGVKVVFAGDGTDLVQAANQSTKAVQQLQTALAKPVPQSGAGKALQDVGNEAGKAGQAVKLSNQQLAQMQFQLQDIAVGLTSGQSPFTVMMQQGSQLSQMFDKGTGVKSAFRAVGEGIKQFITNPLNLAVLGAGLAATAIGTIATVVMDNFPSASRELEKHADLVKRISENWDSSANGIRKYSIETNNSLLGAALKQGEKLEAQRLSLSVASVARTGWNGELSPSGRVGGINMALIEQSGNQQLIDAARKFIASVLARSPDITTFRAVLGDLTVTARDNAPLQNLVNRLQEATTEIANTEEAIKKNNDAIKGLKGDVNAMNDALGKGSDKVKGLTRALDDLAGKRHDNIFGYDALKPTQAYSGPASITGLGAAPDKLRPMIIDAAKQYGLDADLLARQIWQESRFNSDAVSSKGAKGLMQLMDGTAGDLKVSNPFDPRANIFGGARYMRQLLDASGGNNELALMKYNWGMGNVGNWINAGADVSKVPEETRNYVSSIMSGGGTIAKGDASLDRTAAREKEEAIAREKRWAQTIRESSAAEEMRSQAIGKSVGEQAQMRKEQELLAQAQRIYGEQLETDSKLRERITAQIEKEAAAYGKLAEATAWATAQKKAQATIDRENIESLDRMRQQGSAIVATMFDAASSARNWGDVFGSVLDSLKAKAADLLENYINKLLFGQQGTSDTGLLGGLGQSLSNIFSGTVATAPGFGMYVAQGAAFAGGIKTFAQGGSFTNSVVTRPTMFGFSGGLGLMGEAGPEAVMPLSGGGIGASTGRGETRLPLMRLRDGSLGVSLPTGFAAGDRFGPMSPGSANAASSAPASLTYSPSVVINGNADEGVIRRAFAQQKRELERDLPDMLKKARRMGGV